MAMVTSGEAFMVRDAEGITDEERPVDGAAPGPAPADSPCPAPPPGRQGQVNVAARLSGRAASAQGFLPFAAFFLSSLPAFLDFGLALEATFFEADSLPSAISSRSPLALAR